MSGLMKKHRIRSTTKKAMLTARIAPTAPERKFLIPIEKVEGLMKIFHEFEISNDSKSEIEKIFSKLNEEYGEVATMLRTARLRVEMTQQELAKRIDIPQRHISEMEHGKRAIGKKMSRKLAKALNIDYRVFL